MPPLAPPSNIRAFAQWREPTVYAGEEIECIITFRNVASPRSEEREDEEPPTPLANGFPRGGRVPSTTQSRRSSIAQSRPLPSRAPSATNVRQVSQGRGHRPTLSLNVVSAPSRDGLHTAPIKASAPHSAKPIKGHGRSLSIMSLGSDAASDGRTPTTVAASRRPVRGGRSRSASLQVMSKGGLAISPALGTMSPRQPSPLYESTTPPALPEGQSEPLPIRPGRRRPGTVSAGNTPQLGRQNNLQRVPTAKATPPEFQFPAASQTAPKGPSPPPEKPKRSPSTMHSGQHRAVSPRPPEGWSGALSNLNPISRVMSESSAGGTPRSSSEFYSMSNHSDETLTSEMPYETPQTGRLLPKPSHSRQASRSRQPSYNRPAEPETLMMAYAQTMGSFTLGSSLVNAAPFEEVKRKGAQSGGGVIGVQRAKRSSGMFGAFGWGNIGESLGGLLGGDDMSSIAQMKATAGSKTVPLLRTPQSLLCVDLTLAPGESKSYNYKFALPRGLPPSHRGRAMKVTYHLALGIQRPEGQAVKTVEVPFHVLGSYNGRGETLGHDLMSPYILMQDAAKTQNISPDPGNPSIFSKFADKEKPGKVKTPKEGLEDFLRYTERLLDQPKDENGALLSPSSPTALESPSSLRRQSLADQPPSSVKEAIDFAILRSNLVKASGKQTSADAQSTNRFNIARSGQPVAVLTILRPAFRLGEAVIGTIDFTALPDAQPQAPTYGVLIELESAERVDPSLALRSSNSINRVTRKVHASNRENTLFAHQVSFNLTIPSTATPTFETTGVSLGWKLKVEFTVQRQVQGLGIEGQMGDDELLEELGRDERGVTMIAKERLLAETFEIAVPIKVFGAAGVEGVGVEPEPLEV